METKPLKFGGGQGLFRRHRGIFNTEEKEELNLWMLQKVLRCLSRAYSGCLASLLSVRLPQSSLFLSDWFFLPHMHVAKCGCQRPDNPAHQFAYYSLFKGLARAEASLLVFLLNSWREKIGLALLDRESVLILSSMDSE